jgi:hypothetical protein
MARFSATRNGKVFVATPAAFIIGKLFGGFCFRKTLKAAQVTFPPGRSNGPGWPWQRERCCFACASKVRADEMLRVHMLLEPRTSRSSLFAPGAIEG